MAELPKNVVERGEQVAVGTRKLGVVGGSDGEPVPLSIMPNDVAAVAGLAHVEFEAVTSLRKRVLKGSQ